MFMIEALALACALHASTAATTPPTPPAPAPRAVPDAPRDPAEPAPAPAPQESATEAAPLPSATEILDRYVEALGGREAWASDTRRTVRMRVEIRSQVGPQGLPNEATGTVVVHRKAPDLFVSTMNIEGVGTMVKGYDGVNAWSISPDGRVRRLEGAELREQQREAWIDRDLRLQELYEKVEVIGAREFSGEPCWLVRFTDSDGAVAQGWFSVDSGHMLGFGRRLQSPVGLLSVVQRFDAFRDFNGRVVPTRISQTVGNTTQTMVIQSIETDAIDEALFQAPANLPPPTEVDAPRDSPDGAAEKAAPSAPNGAAKGSDQDNTKHNPPSEGSAKPSADEAPSASP